MPKNTSTRDIPLSAIREASERDLPRLEALYASFQDRAELPNCVPESSAEQAQWLSSVLKRGFSFIAEEDGELAAHLALIRIGDAAEMCVFVHPAFRKRGIGTSLLRTAIEQAKDMGVRYVWLSVDSEDTALQAGLRHFGFSVSLRKGAKTEMVLSF